MANTTINMQKVRQIIRLKSEGKSNRLIAQVLKVHRTTVRKYVAGIESLAISYEELLLKSDAELKQLFMQPADPCKDKRTEALNAWFPYMDKELKRVGVDRWNLWMEYKETHPDGYAYSHFCRAYNRHQRQDDVSMHFEHKAGDKLYIDFTGSKLEVVDRSTGEVKKVEVLISVLGCSQLTYVEATESQKKDHFITGVENALHYFGGVPRAIVPDNLKSAVTKACKYEPYLNETFQDFALYYGTVILPTRSLKPRDKALVERTVNIIYKRIYAPLRNTIFFSLAELNEAIRELLEDHHKLKFKGKDHSRRELFDQVERETLGPLPQSRYELKKYAWVTVLKSSHVCLSEDKHYYSVHYKYLGEKVKVCYTLTSVEVYHKGERIALHQRSRSGFKYTTVKEHLPSTHNFVSEWSPEKFLGWAEDVGAEARVVVEKILQSRPHPEQAYKACVGILSFARKVGKDRLNNACSRAMFYQSYTYGSIKSILDNGLDKQPIRNEEQYALPLHGNIRGKDYYQ